MIIMSVRCQCQGKTKIYTQKICNLYWPLLKVRRNKEVIKIPNEVMILLTFENELSNT